MTPGDQTWIWEEPVPMFATPEVHAWRDTSTLPAFIPPTQRWLCSLLDSIGRPRPTDQPSLVTWHSPWGRDVNALYPEGGNETEKHRLYIDTVRTFAAREMPWLEPVMAGAQAMVMVAPGYFRFSTPGTSEWTDVPELVPCTCLLPWATPTERQSPN